MYSRSLRAHRTTRTLFKLPIQRYLCACAYIHEFVSVQSMRNMRSSLYSHSPHLPRISAAGSVRCCRCSRALRGPLFRIQFCPVFCTRASANALNVATAAQHRAHLHATVNNHTHVRARRTHVRKYIVRRMLESEKGVNANVTTTTTTTRPLTKKPTQHHRSFRRRRSRRHRQSHRRRIDFSVDRFA